MNKSRRKLIIFGLALLAVVSVVFIVFKAKSSPNQTRVEKFQQNLNIPNYFQVSGFKIVNNTKISDFKFPQKLPYLQQTNIPSVTIEAAKKIASNLGLTGDPLVVTGIKNQSSFIWNGDPKSLVVDQSTNNVQVVSSASIRDLVAGGLGKGLPDGDYSTLAQDFLINKIGLSASTLHFSGFSYFKIQNGIESFAKGTKEDSDIVQLNYYQGGNNLPILTTNPDEPQIYVRLLKGGAFVSFSANLGADFQNSVNEYPLKNYDQFSQDIGNSIIVSLNDNNINLPDLESDSISNIQVNTVSLVYLLNGSRDTIVQPVFLIQGTADVSGRGNVSLSMYLPAFEGFSQP